MLVAREATGHTNGGALAHSQYNLEICRREEVPVAGQAAAVAEGEVAVGQEVEEEAVVGGAPMLPCPRRGCRTASSRPSFPAPPVW